MKRNKCKVGYERQQTRDVTDVQQSAFDVETA